MLKMGWAMRSVIERHGHHIDERGFIHYDDRPTTYEAAEAIARKRLDRRRNYAIIEGDVCEAASWSQTCSGCSEGPDDAGHGCRECGYTGTTRESMWVPMNDIED
jgi:hypothetical protein